MGIKITNATGDRPTLWLYGTIGADFGEITADNVRLALSEIPVRQNFDVRIYSDGGSFDEAMAIHSLLSSRAKKTHAIVDGLAASAASLLLQSSGERTMAQHSRQMIHQAHGRTTNFMAASEFRAAADQLDAINREITSIYAKRWKGSVEDLDAALGKDTWLDAEESVASGLADNVGDSMAIAARVNQDIFAYANVPDDVILASGPYIPPWKAQMHEKYAAAFGS